MRSIWAVLSAATAAILWGSLGIVIRLAEGVGGSVDMLIVGRTLGGAILSMPILAYYRVRPGFWSLIIALLGLAPLYYTYMKAVSIIGAAPASLLLYTAPFWVVILGFIILGERPGSHGIVAVALGVAGAAMVSGVASGSWRSLDPQGLLYGLSSGFSYALYIVLARLAQKREAGVLQAGLAPAALTGLILLLVVHPSRSPSQAEFIASIYLAAFTLVVPYILHVYALKHVEAHRVSIISLLEPLSAVTLAYAILGERLDTQQLLGAVLIIGATLVSNLEVKTVRRGSP